MRRLHLIVGLLNAVAFLSSGMYMRFVVNPHLLTPDTHMLFVSRHIYMLGPALVHLVLSAYVHAIPRLAIRSLQWVGSMFLVTSSILLVSAFIVECINGHGRSEISAYGLYTFGAGSILHAIVGRLGDDPR